MFLAKRIVWTAFFILFSAACTQLAGQSSGKPDLLDDRELIVLTDGPVQTLIETAQSKGYQLRAIHPLEALNDKLVVFEIPDGQTIPGAIAEIEAALPEVTAGAHHLYRLQADESARGFAETMIGWPADGCRIRQRVGIIDAGVAGTHPGLNDGRIIQQSFTPSDAAPRTDHGSLMADLLVGPGKLRGDPLFSANVIDPDISGPSAAGVVSILRGMNWMRENGVDVVNISLAGPRNKLLNRGLGEAAANGVVIVAAAGNSGPSSPPLYPAAFPFTIAVTAIDTNMQIYDRAVRGPHIDVAAPGVDVLVQSDTGVRLAKGTSVAAPFATAILAADPNLATTNIEAVKDQLAKGAIDLGPSGSDPVFGAGLISAQFSCQR